MFHFGTGNDLWNYTLHGIIQGRVKLSGVKYRINTENGGFKPMFKGIYPTYLIVEVLKTIEIINSRDVSVYIA